ncbi:MAG: thrombospondin type 3 repeat-containing protein [Rhodospirillaceae bacterium]
MKTLIKGLMGPALVSSMLALGACSTDGSYTSVGVGISSYGGYYDGGYGVSGTADRDWDGIPNRFDRDRDGDGVPNRLDSRPNNPRWR